MKVTDNFLPKIGNILYGENLEEPVRAKITAVGTKQFTNKNGTKRDAIQLTVSAPEIMALKDDKGKQLFSEDPVFALNATTTEYLVDKLGEETDKWINTYVNLSPVPSETPEGVKTTVIAVTVAKAK
jgi:hypothetical protein